MVKKLLSITVLGKTGAYCFNFYGDPKYLNKWREEGLDVNEVSNVIPKIVTDLKINRAWCFFQDMFNFKNPF